MQKPFSLSDFLAQLGLAPQLVQPPPPPAAPVQPPPFDTSVMPGTAFGTPYPYPAPTDMGAAPAPRETAAAPVDTGYGYMPQPRADLPSQLGDTGVNPDLFNTFRNLYSPAAQEQDPLQRLLGDTTAGLPGFQQVAPPSRALTPPGFARQAGPQYGAQQPMSASERQLRDRGPAFSRVADRIHELNTIRQRRGF